MNPQTEKNLLAAMHGEAFAYAKYLRYADVARQAGAPELAELFEKTAQVELHEHFREESELVGVFRTNLENLGDAIAGEAYEVDTMYREFAEQAQAAGDLAAAARFIEIRADEMAHRAAFQAALHNLEGHSGDRAA